MTSRCKNAKGENHKRRTVRHCNSVRCYKKDCTEQTRLEFTKQKMTVNKQTTNAGELIDRC